MKLCAHYLLEERVDGRTPDPVANFHLSNGARIDRINWLADVSEKGVEKSMGLMVNYRYELDEIEKNHEAYRSSGVAAGSRQVLSLLESTGQSTPDPRSG
jgi:malonyl-CoA decarboxylase